MADDNKQAGNQVNFSMDPAKTPVMYADSYLIGSNEHVMTLTFAQAVPQSSQQHVVSRVALTHKQAKDLLQRLNEHVEKYEI